MWLVRHGSTDWSGQRWCGRTDLPLNGRGRAEADALAGVLAGPLSPGTVLMSSPLRRALETAHRLAAVTGSTAIVDGRLREVDFGDLEGLGWSELEAREPDIAKAIATGTTSIDWPGGETGREVAARVGDLWQEVESESDDVVLVSHGGAIREMLRQALMTETASLEIRPAAIIRLEPRQGAWVRAR